MTKGMDAMKFWKTFALRGAGMLALVGGLQACGEQAPAPEVVLGTYNGSVPLQGSVVMDSTVPEVDSVLATMRSGGKKKVLLQESGFGRPVKLDSVDNGASYTASVVGFENSAGVRVARWWAFATDTADYSGKTQTVLLRAVGGPGLDALPKLDSTKVGVVVPAVKGLWITMDSTDPRASKSAKPVAAPLTLTKGQLYRVALRSDSVASTGQPALWSNQATWIIRGNTPVPNFSVASGSHSKALHVRLTDSLPGATILWSRDSLTWSVFKDSVPVDSSSRIFARAVLKGMDTSRIVSASYELKVSAPRLSVASGTYSSAQTVVLSDSTAGVTYRCSADSSAWEACQDSVVLSVSSKLFVQATRAGWTSSPVVQASYRLQSKAPRLSVASGTYDRAQSVVLSDSTLGVAYSCSPDSVVWAACGDTVAVTASGSLFVKASKAGWDTSAVVRAKYELKVGAPVLSVPSGTYAGAQSVVLSDSTPGVAYSCSSDSVVWAACSDTVAVTASGTLFVQASKVGWTSSAVVKASYAFKLAAPVFSVPAGTYPEAQTVRVSSAAAGAKLECSLDGTTWTDCTDAPVAILATGTLQARAAKAGWTSSDVISAAYVIETAPVTP
ncbi:MAG: hypothetical protein RL318_1868 [Fibrobacterota bacterium]